MMDDKLFVARLRQEILLWEQEGIVPHDLAEALRSRYGLAAEQPVAEAGQWIRWVLYLAVVAFLAAFFSFAGSTAAALGPTVRVAVLLSFSLGALAAGAVYYRRRRTEGMALLILGGLLLPISYYFTVHQYHLWQLDVPYLGWCLLAGVMAVLYGLAALRLQEEGLGGAALLGALAVPFMLATHAELDRAVYAPLAASLSLVCLSLEKRWPEAFRPAFAKATWLVGYVLATTALLLPLPLFRYASEWTVLAYLLAASYYFLRLRQADSPISLVLLTIAMVAGVGAFVRAENIGSDLLPLIQLAFSLLLIGAGVLFLRRRGQALSTLLGTLFFILLPGLIVLMYLQPHHFRGIWLFYLTVGLYAAIGALLYALARLLKEARGALAFLAGWHIFAALVLGEGGSLGTEAYCLLLGALLLLNLLFVPEAVRFSILVLATLIMALPSLVYSATTGSALRTVLLSLGGIALITVGAFRRHAGVLILGMLVMLPAIFIKILPGLAELGIPRFVWFACFGVLLVAAAMLLQRRLKRAAAKPAEERDAKGA